MTGHTLGAAGALEAAFCWLSLSTGNKNTPCRRTSGMARRTLNCRP
jgi:3-oxoacyl-(acyl-carrier-protein) synthase